MSKSRKSKSPAVTKPPLTLICFFLAGWIVFIYWRVLENGFVNFDDNIYVYANDHIQNGLTLDGLRWAFTTISYVYYQPMTWISHMLDVTWFGLNPAGHHIVSVLIHGAISVLLLLWLYRTTGAFWRSAYCAALFSLHPLRVESVAWIAERKDVLSTLFFVASLLAYAQYAKKPSPSRYLLTAAALVFGLLSKPMLVVAPLLFLLTDYWPLRRSGSPLTFLREKIPFFLLAGVSAVITYLGQKQAGAMYMLDHLSLFHRGENAIVSYTLYLGKTVWPYPLTVLYPYNSNLPAWQVVASAILFSAITLAVIRAGQNHLYLLVGWLWFVIGLLPAIGLVQVGMQAYADRFSYIPSIGLLIALVWGFADGAKRYRWPANRIAILAALILILMSGVTWNQLGYWRDSITLLQYTVDHTTDNPLAEQDLGTALGERNRNAEAIVHLAAAVREQPNFFQGYYNLGKAQASEGKTEAAIGSFTRALRLNPSYGEAFYARAVMYEKNGNPVNAESDLHRSLKLGLPPFYQAEAYNNLGVLAARSGNVSVATAEFQRAVRIRPDFAGAQVNLGTALAESGRKQDALTQLSSAVAATHGDPSVRSALSRLQGQP